LRKERYGRGKTRGSERRMKEREYPEQFEEINECLNKLPSEEEANIIIGFFKDREEEAFKQGKAEGKKETAETFLKAIVKMDVLEKGKDYLIIETKNLYKLMNMFKKIAEEVKDDENV
jgi:hypothetical protein